MSIIGGNFAFSAGGQFGRASAGASAGEQLGCQLGPSLVWSVGASASQCVWSIHFKRFRDMQNSIGACFVACSWFVHFLEVSTSGRVPTVMASTWAERVNRCL